MQKRLAVSACLFLGGKVLLTKRTNPPFQGCFSFPGGRVERGESLEEAIRREIFEETALILHAPIARLTLEIEDFTLTVFTSSFSGMLKFGDDAEVGGFYDEALIPQLPTTPNLLELVTKLKP